MYIRQYMYIFHKYGVTKYISQTICNLNHKTITCMKYIIIYTIGMFRCCWDVNELSLAQMYKRDVLLCG